jgi:hypothetical protein
VSVSNRSSPRGLPAGPNAGELLLKIGIVPEDGEVPEHGLL